MLIVADENIPLVESSFGQHGEVKRLPGRQIKKSDLLDADILLVRSVTRVDQALIDKTPLRFIGTATIGTDHLDINYLNQPWEGDWASAPGSNADSVADYVVSCLATLLKEQKIQQLPQNAGVIGVGNVGRRVVKRLKDLGIKVQTCDPYRALKEKDFEHTPIEELKHLDLLCLHAPLHDEEPYPTHQLVQKELLENLSSNSILISAGRGPVLDFSYFQNHTAPFFTCLDVWDPEPNVPTTALSQSTLSTPHIAGYATQGKWRATEMLYQKASETFNWEPFPIQKPLEPPLLEFPQAKEWHDIVLGIYKVKEDSQRMKALLDLPDDLKKNFDLLRKNYPIRHELSFPLIKAPQLQSEDAKILRAWGVQIES